MATMKKRQEDEARSVAEQAAEWLLILEDGKPEDQAALADWLRRSPVHVGAFLRASAIDELGARVDPEKAVAVDMGPFPDRAEIGRDAREDERQAVKGGDVRRFGFKGLALAASVVLVVALTAFVVTSQWLHDPWTHYSAAVGEQKVLMLADGSTMYLEPGSSIDIRFLANERRLKLVKGGAMFKVAHDVTRPFRVHAGATVVQAVGTQFSVIRIRNDSVVSVVEGVVQVEASPVRPSAKGADPEVPHRAVPLRLAAGEEARVSGSGEVSSKKAEADPVKGWNDRRLTFVNETLYAIADEFNRYNERPKIRVADASAGELRFAAAFAANDPQSLVDVLATDSRLKIKRDDSEIVIFSK
jgi:transmembrane sensor